MESFPGAAAIAFSMESNLDALFHIADSVTSGIEMIPDSSAKTDKIDLLSVVCDVLASEVKDKSA